MKKILSLLLITSLISGFAVAGNAKDSEGKKSRKKTEKTVKADKNVKGSSDSLDQSR
ncbi:hypothetical protein LBMAG18_03830 [Alphaproteobacteria bacterium]|nr:hypothetical protein LBMAG18_03830 [Alphaproteobacteria bacterium]